MIPLPDLLFPRPTAGLDEGLLEEMLEVSFLGGDPGADLARAMESVALPDSPWSAEFFAEGLFLDDLVERCFTIDLAGRRFPIHRRFLAAFLSKPPADAETVRYRQGILAELEGDAALRRRAESLYEQLFHLLGMFKSPGQTLGRAGSIDQAGYRLEVLRQVARVIDALVADFAGCTSGLVRLHEVGLQIRDSPEHRTLAALLDHEGHLSELTLRVRVAADGRIRSLDVDDLRENRANPFHRPPGRRWLDRLRVHWHGLDLDRSDVVNRLIVAVYGEIAPALRTVLQVLGHLEVYLGALAWGDEARRRGLAVCRAELAAPDERLELVELFNPLLLRHGHEPPVPCDIAPGRPTPTVLVTGPNSGGKTRMLQAVGIAQLLGQSGLYVPARRARLPLAQGLFVSLIEHASADQTEGRLGAELVRIRRLFEEARPGSVILLDELCSGTNPSEAVEIVALVLDLLRGLRSTTFITTHFLDYTRQLAARPPSPDLEFLRVLATAEGVPTYRFTAGVAETSLAAATARRMGVTFESLADLLVRRFGVPRPRRDGGHIP